MADAAHPTAADIDALIVQNLDELRKPGVLTVRPGYEIAGQQLTGQPAIVATVHTKRADLPPSDLLPDHIGNIPVDVREASPHQRLRAHDPAAALVASTFARPESSEPTWPLERELPSGRLLEDPLSATRQALNQDAAVTSPTVSALAAHSRKPHIQYEPPSDAPLDPIETTAAITVSVSPDAGLATLTEFLEGTTESLVIGMYDFTSGRILKIFETVLAGGKKLQMVLDNPAPNETRDQLDKDTVEQLDESLGNSANIVWALNRADVFAAAWEFPFAYHIKVIVRDGTAVWLSSGNLNNSNEPDLASPPTTEDRDWHIIVEDPGLARLFTTYLNRDFESARRHQAASAADAQTVMDAQAKLAAEIQSTPLGLAQAPVSNFAKKTFPPMPVKITPLLTPDKLPDDPDKGQYLNNIVHLINGAEQKLFIELQYIEASRGGDYEALLKAIADRIDAGVDVRLIESSRFTDQWIEKMKTQGVDLTAKIARRPSVHNKGFVVDSKIAVVSSQNFSPAGVFDNRDAGLIIENSEVAQYFEAAFLFDWEHSIPVVGR